jgi:hypothetical protein
MVGINGEAIEQAAEAQLCPVGISFYIDWVRSQRKKRISSIAVVPKWNHASGAEEGAGWLEYFYKAIFWDAL